MPTVEARNDSVLLLARPEALPVDSRIWGNDVHLPPEEREALDWLTLLRLLGWGVSIPGWYISGSARDSKSIHRVIVVASEPDAIDEECVRFLHARLAMERILVVVRAGAPRMPISVLAGANREATQIAGKSVCWSGPGSSRTWKCRQVLKGVQLGVTRDVSTWATLEGVPLIVARKVGRGTIATLGFHPSEARDANGVATSLLKHLLIFGSSLPAAWFDLEGAMVLRMDDAGGSQNIFLKSWCYPKLKEREWVETGAELKRRNARMSIAYIPGWVDDGERGRGQLRVAGRAATRVPGTVFPSPLVQYRDLAGHRPGTVYDYSSEFRGVQRLRRDGLAEVELHGFTHTNFDTAVWARAQDRYENAAWYRDFAAPRDGAGRSRRFRARAFWGRLARSNSAEPVQASRQVSSGIQILQRYFEVAPTTLVCPQNFYTHDAIEAALDHGLYLVAGGALGMRDHQRLCWVKHIPTRFLDAPEIGAFEAGLPVAVLFHDKDLALEGIRWMNRWLAAWELSGARKVLDLRELAATVSRRLKLEDCSGSPRLRIEHEDAPQLVRPFPVYVRVPEGNLPRVISSVCGEVEASLPIEPIGNGCGRVMLTPAAS